MISPTSINPAAAVPHLHPSLARYDDDGGGGGLEGGGLDGGGGGSMKEKRKMSPWLLTTNWWNKRASSPRLGGRKAAVPASPTVFTMAEQSLDLSAGQKLLHSPFPHTCKVCLKSPGKDPKASSAHSLGRSVPGLMRQTLHLQVELSACGPGLG